MLTRPVAAIVLLTACASPSTRAGAFVAARPAGNGPLRWTPVLHGTLAIWVDSSPATPGWRPEFIELVIDAANEWAASGVPIRFIRVDALGLADVRVHWRRCQPAPSRGGTTERGVTTRWVNSRGEIVGADVIITLAPGRARPVSAPQDLRAIALHELGHVLGLPHDRSDSTIMSPRVGPPVLTDRDREALRATLTLGRVGSEGRE